MKKRPKRKKSIWVLLLALVFLIGCGQESKGTEESRSKSGKQADTQADDQTDIQTDTQTDDQTAPQPQTEDEESADVEDDDEIRPFELEDAWLADQEYTLTDPAPKNLTELKKAVDIHDPRGVAAYWVLAVNRLTEDYDDGMAMMKYLFADIEPYGRGFTEGGVSGRAGWDSYFDERLGDDSYSWLLRAYFEGSSTRKDKFALEEPLRILLHYNEPNTRTINEQTLDALGRLNIEYWVESRAAGNKVSITLSRFEDTNRWYVTSGTSSSALFYMQ
ncbi:MAG: hypothetical protein K6B72_13260 [Lachnospiraceae bacterium]|nr:hypothetical protein [Lachnospiraceae bacterium]